MRKTLQDPARSHREKGNVVAETERVRDAWRSHMKPSAHDAWTHLQLGLETITPACHGDARFVAEKTQLDPENLADMREICGACPLFELCAEYQRLDRPRGGFWAESAT